MKNFIKKHYLIIVSIMIGIILIWPYLYLNGITYEHDTFFHISRIEGYANSIKNWDFFPTIYPYKNDYFAYPSPSFYCDFYLLPFAVIYLLTSHIVLAYILFLTTVLILTAYFMGITVGQLTNNKYCIIAAILLYSFSPYHLSDIYVRSAIGELVGMMLLPLVVKVSYSLFYDKVSTLKLALIFTALVFAHNLSFYLAIILFAFLIILNLNRINLKIFKQICSAALIAIGLSACYTFNLIAFIKDQNYVLFYYSNPGLLKDTGLQAFQYFLPIINFNLWSYDLNALVVGPGFLLILIPITLIFNLKLVHKEFIYKLWFISLIFLLLSSSYWDYSSFYLFSFLQFIWRLMMIPTLLLAIISPLSLFKLTSYFKETLIVISVIIITLTGISQYKLITRNNIIKLDLPYQSIINGDLIDPYYSSDYKRVELAGGEYLPINHLATKDLTYGIYDLNLNKVESINFYNYQSINFSILNDGQYLLPKYYYLGYHLYDKNQKELAISQDLTTGLIKASLTSGNYTLSYQKPLASKIGIFTSLLTLLIILITKLKKTSH